MNEIPAADGSFLISAGRSVSTPFKVRLHSDSGEEELTCNRILRNLPGRRLVCGGEKNGEEIVVKFFLDKKRSERHCIREERGNLALKEAGIAAPQILLKGRLKPFGGPALVFSKIDPGLDFTDAWQQAESDEQRSRLLKSLASATAAMHEAGLIHNDAHPGNFMISGGLLYAIDGASVNIRSRGKPLSKDRSLKNLAAFFAQFSVRFDYLLPDAFEAYVKKRKWPQNNQLLHGRLAGQVRIQRKKREKNYLKKIYRKSSAHVCKKS
ncbi:MAG: hypothetical protein KGY38_05495, partial [Desulfobacterales bacterium]|nr:hypothetical protein [Desulfobacterales bacterium]